MGNEQKSLKVITREDLETHLNKKKDVLLVMHSPGCGHCVNMMPALEELADKVKEKADDKLLVGTVNMVENDMPEYDVKFFPTIFLIKLKQVKEFYMKKV